MEGIRNKVSDYSSTGFTPACHSSLSLQGLDTIVSVMVSNSQLCGVSIKCPLVVTNTISSLGTQILLPPLLTLLLVYCFFQNNEIKIYMCKVESFSLCALSSDLISKKRSQRELFLFLSSH